MLYLLLSAYLVGCIICTAVLVRREAGTWLTNQPGTLICWTGLCAMLSFFWPLVLLGYACLIQTKSD
jgi:hypothetical protein